MAGQTPGRSTGPAGRLRLCVACVACGCVGGASAGSRGREGAGPWGAGSPGCRVGVRRWLCWFRWFCALCPVPFAVPCLWSMPGHAETRVPVGGDTWGGIGCGGSGSSPGGEGAAAVGRAWVTERGWVRGRERGRAPSRRLPSGGRLQWCRAACADRALGQAGVRGRRLVVFVPFPRAARRTARVVRRRGAASVVSSCRRVVRGVRVLLFLSGCFCGAVTAAAAGAVRCLWFVARCPLLWGCCRLSAGSLSWYQGVRCLLWLFPVDR